MDKIVNVGRRKTSVARVFVSPAKVAGKGTITINKRSFENYFPVDIHRIVVMQPFTELGISPEDFDIVTNINGGGITGQAEAFRLGIARSLVEMKAENRPALKKKGLLTRDSRMVERKKYGQPKARKQFQFSKR
mgnify:CR=1 FL=1